MPTKRVVLELPEIFFSAAKIRRGEVPAYIRETLAMELYREGAISLGKAAELAGVANKWQMIALLGERHVPLRYSAEDAEEDLKTLDTLLG